MEQRVKIEVLTYCEDVIGRQWTQRRVSGTRSGGCHLTFLKLNPLDRNPEFRGSKLLPHAFPTFSTATEAAFFRAKRVDVRPASCQGGEIQLSDIDVFWINSLRCAIFACLYLV